MFLPGKLSIISILSLEIQRRAYRPGPIRDRLRDLSPQGLSPISPSSSPSSIGRHQALPDYGRTLHLLRIADHRWTNRVSPSSVCNRHPTDHPPRYSTSSLPQLLRDLDHLILIVLPFVGISWPSRQSLMLTFIRLYTGTQSNPEPPWSLCATQAILAYCLPVL